MAVELEVIRLEGVGDIANERVILRAKTALKLAQYGVFACRRGDIPRPLSGYFPGGFWFPGKDVAANDFVIVYTKAGRASEKVTNQVTSYFYYMGLLTPLWSAGNLIPVSVFTPAWDMMKDLESTTEPEPKKIMGAG
jgi:hypothetical protein